MYLNSGKAEENIKVGGQAVIEGVMMRSPHSMVISVRKPDSSIVVRDDQWRSLWEKFKVFRLPFLRGTVILVETLVNGIQALTFSADQAAEDEQEGDNQLGPVAMTLTVVFAFAMGLVLFVVLPHLFTWLLSSALGRELNTDNILFHFIDTLFKLGIFILYIYLISLMKDIQRVFMYHGAEHKSIYTYEAGMELNVNNARGFSTLHPRCGTSFLILVLLISFVLFGIIFPFVPPLAESKLLNHLLLIGIKIPLMLPVAGISYEIIKLSGKKQDNLFFKLLSWPGMMVQKLTTKEPTDNQLEIALCALRKSLWHESRWQENSEQNPREINIYKDFNEFLTKDPSEVSQEAQGLEN